MTEWREKEGNYWNYNIDHLGKHDIDAFIRKIISEKAKEHELSEEQVLEKLRITYVGHSMGGMTLPIYLISKAEKNEAHNLYQAILMSPAGFHTKARVTYYLDAIGKFFVYGLSRVTDHFAMPELIIEMGTKLQTELQSIPATRDLLSYVSSLVVGGQSTGKTFYQSSHLMKSLL